MNLQKVVTEKEMREMQYYRSRLHCENSDVKVAALELDCYAKRVGLNLLDVFPDNYHPHQSRAKSFKFQDKHFDLLDLKQGKDRQIWEVKDLTVLDEMYDIL